MCIKFCILFTHYTEIRFYVPLEINNIPREQSIFKESTRQITVDVELKAATLIEVSNIIQQQSSHKVRCIMCFKWNTIIENSILDKYEQYKYADLTKANIA